MTTTIIFQDKEIRNFLKKAEVRSPQLVKKALNQTAIFGIKQTKKILPKKTGLLRQSYQVSAPSKETRLIAQTKLKAIGEGIESGFKAKTVRPRRKKFLTIPIRKNVLTSTGAQIKQAALNKLFKNLKKPRGRSPRQIFNESGIVLTRQANVPRIPGQFNFRDRIAPSTQRFMNRKLNQVFVEIGFR
jgi:hypothetical protein